MINFLYPFKALYYYSYFIYIKYNGSYDERLRLERIYNEIDYKWRYGESMYKEMGNYNMV